MANFERAFLKTSAFEGGYANHSDDKGGETYKGIARNIWGTWAGWKIIDRYKSSPHSVKQLNAVLGGNIELQDMVEEFYKAHFWKAIKGDDLNNQLIADNIYDFAVNSGVSRAVKYAQRIVNADEDGIMGAKTIKAINKNIEGFVTNYKSARLTFLAKIVERDSSQSVFMNGWRTRVQNA